MPVSPTPILSTPTRSRRPWFALATAVLSTSFIGCGNKSAEQATPAPSPAAATPAVVKRTAPPLPAPGEGGVFARHGGLVASGGEMNFELVAVDGVARVYLYTGAGDPAAPQNCRATLTVDGGESYELQRKLDGSVVFMEGGQKLPASFDARLVMEFEGKPFDVSLRYAAAGAPTDTVGEAPAAAAPVATPAAGGAPATQPTGR